MFVWKKTFDKMVAHYRGLFEMQGDVIAYRDQTIGRLQRENARLLAELAPLKAERERRMAPLIAANEARRAKALAKQQEVVSV